MRRHIYGSSVTPSFNNSCWQITEAIAPSLHIFLHTPRRLSFLLAIYVFIKADFLVITAWRKKSNLSSYWALFDGKPPRTLTPLSFPV